MVYINKKGENNFMKGMRKVSAILLAVMLCVGIINITAFAKTISQDGLEVTLTTNKDKYSQGEKIITTLKVKNTNDYAVRNISLKGIIPKGYKLDEGTEETEKIDTLEAGKTYKVNITYVAKAKANLGKDNKETKKNENSSNSSSVDTGDKSDIVVYFVGICIALSIILFIITKKVNKKFLSILLCITTVGTTVSWHSIIVDAAETDIKTIMVEKTIQINGKDVTLNAEINYQIVEDDYQKREVEIIVDDDNLKYEEANDCYYLLNDSTDSIKGKITGEVSLLKNIEYEILDDKDITIKKGNIKEGSIWSIDNIALMVGKNTVSIKATLTDDSYVKTSFTIMNTSTKHVVNADIDTGDNDGDGLNNYLEDYYNTNKENADTDGDGLNDFVELSVLGTNPNKKDSDGNGVSDDLEDNDKDGINNISELKQGTDPKMSDTDGDGLSDFDEIKTYKTDPLNADTDGDGANDGWEVANKYDPLKKENRFSLKEEISNEDIAVKVEMDVDGNCVEALSVNENNEDMLFNDKLPGYIGSAYDFSLSGKSFDSAKISFTFDESLLNKENFKPVIYYFNEEKQILEELKTNVDGNTASTTVSHFSTYILLNKTEFDKVWETEIKPPEYTGDPDALLDVAFVIDYSNSMEENDPNQLFKALSKEMITKLRDSKDQAAVVKFIKQATLVQGLTADKEALNTAIDSISYDNGYGWNSGTDGSTGIKEALDELTPSKSKYKYVIFVTDGEDNGFSYSYDSLISNAKENNINIYTVGMGSASENILRKVAENTGGKYYHATTTSGADDILNLEDVFDEIGSETIDYTVDSNADGISDYFTKLICEGKLVTGTGVKLFDGVPFEEVQKNADYDKDGLKNGEEVSVVVNDGKVYLKALSSPVLADTDMDGYLDSTDTNRLAWNVGPRDLAIFASLAYEDGSNYISKMYKASDIKGSENESGEKYYFLNGASIKENGIDYGISQKWEIVDYVNTWEDIDTYFSATTFKNDNNIVIAYRGTNDPVGEWVNNIVGVGMLNYHSEEGAAKNYALKIAKKYSNCNIYITGHSLGGYLAQIGASEMLQKCKVNLKSVMYFNGIGLKYNKLLFWTKNKDMDTLENYAWSHSLISYEIKGDVVSALGEHSGEIKSYFACDDARKHHAGKYGTGNWTDFLSKSAAGWLCVISGKNLAQYYEQYGVQSIMEYFWVTHETDSFLYHLSQGSRGR